MVAEKASATRASDMLFWPHGRSRSGRDSETRAVQGGGGVRPRQGAAVRAALVGGGVPRSGDRQGRGLAARLSPERRGAGAEDQASAAGGRVDARRRAAE